MLMLTNGTASESLRIKIYAPWCGHCVTFAPVYADIADEYHSSENRKIRVGKINGDAEMALMARFGVKSYPSIFVVDGWSVYKFEAPRSKQQLMKFVEGDYKKQAPLPFFKSPMGPIGLAQGTLLALGYRLADVFEWLQSTAGLSPLFAGMAMFGSLFIGLFFCIVFLAIVITPKVKSD